VVDPKIIEEVAVRLGRARRVTVVTGAGVSAASGVPTFRGQDGLWKSYRLEDLATLEAFNRAPKRVWDWYQWRRQLISSCVPNRAHEVLAGWSQRFPEFHLVTQNVDGLHERAGTFDVIRFHGSIWEVFCHDRCSGSPTRWWDETTQYRELPPPCPYCNGIIRPGVVWFGEAIPVDAFERSNLATDCDVFLVVGTASVVYPAAGLVGEAGSRGAYTVEVNVEATAVSNRLNLSLVGPAEEILNSIDARMR
jgi:NAD-dependent deacetylase